VRKLVICALIAIVSVAAPAFGQESPRVNGITLNVTSLTLGPPIGTISGGSTISPMGTQAFPQTVPAAAPTQIPGSLGSLPTPTSPFRSMFPPPSVPSLAVARPDFIYRAAKLSFEKLTGSSKTGQKGMDAGPGTPTGVKRFAPVGEY
jgi:hypothetical protein